MSKPVIDRERARTLAEIERSSSVAAGDFGFGLLRRLVGDDALQWARQQGFMIMDGDDAALTPSGQKMLGQFLSGQPHDAPITREDLIGRDTPPETPMALRPGAQGIPGTRPLRNDR